MTTTHQLTDLGYSVLAQGVPSGPCKVDVWSRVSAEREGWDYIVSLPGAVDKTHQGHQVLNLEMPLTKSPTVVDIGRLLVQANALEIEPDQGCVHRQGQRHQRFRKPLRRRETPQSGHR